VVVLGLFYCYNEAVVRASHHLLPLATVSWPIECGYFFICLFYSSDLPQAKLPWVRWHRFETWFWEKVRLRWLPAASAATVLARQYAKDLSSDMRGAPGRLLKDAWNAPGRFARRVRDCCLCCLLPHDRLPVPVNRDFWHAVGAAMD
jgi:hypothetical protein